MSPERFRIASIALFAAAAVLAGVGNETGTRLLTGFAFGLFALGAAAFLKWRRARFARVLDREEKTSENGGDP